MWQPSNAIENYTLWLLILSAILAVVAIIQIFLYISANRAAVKAANAAIESNEISRKTFIADQRPWIRLDVGIGGALRYDDEGWDAGMRWHFPLKYSITNIGKSPGTNVSFFAQIIPYTLPHWPSDSIVDGQPVGKPVTGTDIETELDNVCGFPEGMTSVNMGFGQSLFPNDQLTGLFGLNGNPQKFEEAKTSQGYSGQFLVLVCVSYGSTFNKEMYRTAKVFNLFKSTSGTITLEGETIPPNELGLVAHPQQIGNIVQ